MAQISVRPNRVKLLKALTDAKKRIETAADKYEVAQAKYKADFATWSASADLSPANVKSSQLSTTRDRYDAKRGEWTYKATGVMVELKKYPTGKPTEPDAPSTGTKNSYSYTEAINELTSVIKLLEMVDDEVVNASVANKVAKYL